MASTKKSAVFLLVLFSVFLSGCKPKKDLSRTDLTAYFSHFPVIKNTKSAEIRLSGEQHKITLKGPLSCFFFLRTHDDPKISFQFQTRGNSGKENTLEIVIEDYLGKKKNHKIPLKSGAQKQEQIDLSPFQNQVLKVSFLHHTENTVETEITEPALKEWVIQGERKKIILLGLDGAAWEVINPMIEEGKLPNLKKGLKEYPP